MRGREAKLVRWLATLVLAVVIAEPALAQRGLGQGKGRRAPERSASGSELNVRPGPGKGLRGGFGPRHGLPPAWMERLQRMLPEEQERFFANNERFRSLPAERQAEIRRRLEEWNRLPTEKRQEILEREQVWRRMSPEQRQRVREEILPRWQQVPPERRRELLRRLRALRDLTDEERNARVADASFLGDLSPEERELLRELARLRIAPPRATGPALPPHP